MNQRIQEATIICCLQPHLTASWSPGAGARADPPGPLQTVGGEHTSHLLGHLLGHLGHGHLDTPPLQGGAGLARLPPLQQGRAQAGAGPRVGGGTLWRGRVPQLLHPAVGVEAGLGPQLHALHRVVRVLVQVELPRLGLPLLPLTGLT